MSKPPRGTYYRVSDLYWPETRTWGEDAQNAGIYLLTCRHRHTEGLFHFPLEYGAADRGWPLKRFCQAFDVLHHQGFVEYDQANQLCLIVNALKWQAPENPNQIKAALRRLNQLPLSPLLIRLQRKAEELCPPFAQAIRQEFGERFAEGFWKPHCSYSLLSQTPSATPTDNAGTVVDFPGRGVA